MSKKLGQKCERLPEGLKAEALSASVTISVERSSLPKRRQIADDEAVQADRRLMRRLADGDQSAFTAFYCRQAPMLFSLLCQMLRDSKEAEDVLQESFVQIWKKAAAFDAARGSVSTWSVMIARHRAIDALRSRERHCRTAEAAAAEIKFEKGGAPRPNPPFLCAEERNRVRNALEALAVPQREAIRLAFFAGLTQVQIAQRLDIPLGTVKARIRRGLLTLRRHLELLTHSGGVATPAT